MTSTSVHCQIACLWNGLADVDQQAAQLVHGGRAGAVGVAQVERLAGWAHPQSQGQQALLPYYMAAGKAAHWAAGEQLAAQRGHWGQGTRGQDDCMRRLQHLCAPPAFKHR